MIINEDMDIFLGCRWWCESGGWDKHRFTSFTALPTISFVTHALEGANTIDAPSVVSANRGTEQFTFVDVCHAVLTSETTGTLTLKVIVQINALSTVGTRSSDAMFHHDVLGLTFVTTESFRTFTPAMETM